MVLMRLRLNARLEDLSYHFGITVPTVSIIIDKWINILHTRLKFLITWPSQEVARANMPRIFKDLYPRKFLLKGPHHIYPELKRTQITNNIIQ